MKKLIGIAAASGLAIALVACGGKSKGVEYEDSSFGLSLKLPGGWEQTSKETEEGMTTVDFKKGDLEASIIYSEAEGLEASGLTPRDFMDLMMAEFAGTDATLQTIHEGSTVIGGVQGYEKTFKGKIEEGEGIARTIILIEGDKMLFIVMAHEGADEFTAKDKKAMDEFVNGLKF
ncbi:MAG: hypothetical protein ABIM46_01470 [candidate division WOR-3 bacterium]